MRTLKPYLLHLVVIALLGLTAWVLGTWVDVRVSDQTGVRLALPSRVGVWHGVQLRYCHNNECDDVAKAVTATETLCQTCRSSLASMSPVERAQLPSDTQFVTFLYTNPSGESLYASVVMSGKERSSIHRPQRCIVGQGREITGSHVIPIAMANSTPLRIMLLDVLHHNRVGGGESNTTESLYAYWFVGQGRETPYHLARMFWLAWDRLVHSVAHKWAYVIVQGQVTRGSARARQGIESFIADFYPQIVTKGNDLEGLEMGP